MKTSLKSSLTILFAAVLISVASATARADNVTFSTTGIITCAGCVGSGTSAVVFGAGANTTSLSFAGSTSALVNTPSNISLGDILANATGFGAMINGTLTLTITQTSPIVGTGNLSGTFTGSIAVIQSSGVVTFSPIPATIGGFTYTIGNSFLLVAPVTGAGGGSVAGDTTLQGTVTGSQIPEPASLVLLVTGLMGTVVAMRKRTRKSQY